MLEKKWQLLNSESVLDCKWLKVEKNSYKTPAGREIPEYYVEADADSAVIFCITEDDKVLIEEQYRAGLGKVSLDLPGGRIDDGEDASEAIKRELLEETGYEAQNVEFLGKFSKNPARSRNFHYIYFAENVKKVSDPHTDDRDDIKLLQVPLEEIFDYLNDGKIECIGCAAAISLVKNRFN
ncbi:TPA: DNA mismatch repair protein MutT [candidate division CPR2 bacterium]|uniref:NUDIX hydrolase n=1 Tax=candidate division CPR2 bacterium GW2011_GWC1_41_48 TaxID=1618344 RepID=A0A0G0YI84_UNCC2|nr:MAG: NUDIX hydrolase [candidate division CPR2 bacterium GW2011_GWC2_39_35]KKR27280.1 MAG: NUDIX hydrolase [candidate division CPR2 bacterium GW2011_GWD2_39_7]KKS09246.1 MAG: NUDIX hydrolase [candidate division CPR2 bacterium GW2011_GWC1_41_48]OGB70487.1 MAG: hypothetical protein A2Y26_03025 [candidate division CPR2 bacterium GWD2_39_7]HBG82001.1 DNA mismatch repair protein MutT [candidate division CPR2 bacterium]